MYESLDERIDRLLGRSGKNESSRDRINRLLGRSAPAKKPSLSRHEGRRAGHAAYLEAFERLGMQPPAEHKSYDADLRELRASVPWFQRVYVSKLSRMRGVRGFNRLKGNITSPPDSPFSY